MTVMSAVVSILRSAIDRLERRGGASPENRALWAPRQGVPPIGDSRRGHDGAERQTKTHETKTPSTTNRHKTKRHKHDTWVPIRYVNEARPEQQSESEDASASERSSIGATARWGSAERHHTRRR